MGLGNFFEYVCPFCGGLYQDIIENGRSLLLHKGLSNTKDPATLPTNKCVPYHKYVVFGPCGHCCPEVFDECRPCKRGFPGALSSPGHPTKTECYCHYCQPEITGEKAPDHPAPLLVHNINSGGGPIILGAVTVGGDFVGRDKNQGLTPSSFITQYELSEAEYDLLVAAAEQGEIQILSVEQIPGSWVKVKGRNFINETDPSFAAKYLEAVQNLQRYGYIIYQSDNLFRLTGSGFEYAQRLKNARGVE